MEGREETQRELLGLPSLRRCKLLRVLVVLIVFYVCVWTLIEENGARLCLIDMQPVTFQACAHVSVVWICNGCGV